MALLITLAMLNFGLGGFAVWLILKIGRGE
jgi:hypothetical protein